MLEHAPGTFALALQPSRFARLALTR
jgi:hypothetical protein